MLVEKMPFELLDASDLFLLFRLGCLNTLLPPAGDVFAESARNLAHRAYSPVLFEVVEPHLRTFVVPVLPGLPLAGRSRERREIADQLRAVPQCLASEKP